MSKTKTMGRKKRTVSDDGIFDADQYPTEEVLDRIRDFKGKPSDWFALCVSAWYNGSVTNELKPDEAKVVPTPSDGQTTYWRFVTGGWSGNEDVINAMRRNLFLWNHTWMMSVAGGLFVFGDTNKIYK